MLTRVYIGGNPASIDSEKRQFAKLTDHPEGHINTRGHINWARHQFMSHSSSIHSLRLIVSSQAAGIWSYP